MAKTKDNPSNESRPAGIGPGDRLQSARIQQGLSIQDVANRMHLSDSILKAIEENDFDEITAPIFVKGYLRAYARIVALNEDEMIEQYMSYYSEEDPPISSTSNMIPELSSSDVRIKWTTYLVVLVLGALIAAWWWNNEQTKKDPISLDAQSSTQEPQAVNEAIPASEIEAVSEINGAAPDPVKPTESQAGVTVEATDSQPTEMTESTEAQSSAIAEAAQAAAVEVVESSAPAEPELQLETVVPVGSQVTRAAPAGSDRLQIIVHADTWADIEDSSGYNLVYDLLRANQNLRLTGAAPFTLFFGNGHGVEVRLNDEVVEVSPFTRDDNTARLKIGS